MAVLAATWVLGVACAAASGLVEIDGQALAGRGLPAHWSSFALGMLLSFARQEPGCREALSAKPSVVRRSLAVLPGRRGRR